MRPPRKRGASDAAKSQPLQLELPLFKVPAASSMQPADSQLPTLTMLQELIRSTIAECNPPGGDNPFSLTHWYVKKMGGVEQALRHLTGYKAGKYVIDGSPDGEVTKVTLEIAGSPIR